MLSALLRRVQRYDMDITFRVGDWDRHGKRRWFVTVYDWQTEPSVAAKVSGAPSLYAALRSCERQLRGRK